MRHKQNMLVGAQISAFARSSPMASERESERTAYERQGNETVRGGSLQMNCSKFAWSF